MRRQLLLALGALTIVASAPAAAQQVDISSGSVVGAVEKLKAEEYVWAPQAAPEGPMLLIVSLSTQRALLFRNGVPIAASTVSTGKTGHATPTGVFTILQKHVEHYSSKYDSAPMPYMQRLTWYGVALHAGKLPGYPASHGCIRLPAGFAKLLYGVTRLGMTVVVSNQRQAPRLAAAPQILAVATPRGDPPTSEYEWHPEKSAQGPVSIIVSSADRKAVVLRNGVEIGSAKVVVDGPVTGSWAYTLRNVDASGSHWLRVSLASGGARDDQVPREEWQRFHAPDGFRKAVAETVRPGTTIVVTSDSLISGAAAVPHPVIEEDTARNP